MSVWVGEMAAPALFTSYLLPLTTSYAPALPSSWLGMTWLPRQWVETILHQFKDVGIVVFLVRTLQSTNQRMYLYLLFLQMAPLCSGCCGRNVKTEFKITALAPYQIAWKSLAYSQDLEGHLKFQESRTPTLTARRRKSPYGCLRKKSRSRCAHFDFGVRSPTPQFQCCYLRTDLAYKNRFFFAPPLHS